MYNYFTYAMELVADNCSDEVLERSCETFFVDVCGDYLPQYQEIYGSFLAKVKAVGFGLSGFVFERFLSALYENEIERVEVSV